ncbi:MAG: glycosyl hydrolase family 28-related protein [Chloroflexota bacterium]
MVTRRDFVKGLTKVAGGAAAAAVAGPTFSAHAFGAIGNGLNDDTVALQTAVNEAATRGAKVFLPAGQYNISQTIEVPAGVTIIGEGVGENPLQITQARGTMVAFDANSTGWAFRFTGHTSGMRDVLVMTQLINSADGGILIEATNNTLMESLVFSNVLVYGFVGGTGLKLLAHNNSGIGYCSFYDVRVRSGGIGYHIEQIRSGAGDFSFVNSNSFYRGAISGGGFDYGVLIDGGNNNVFNALIVEPPSSTFGQIVVNSGQIVGNQIRVEASSQPHDVPVIEFKAGTEDSYLDGFVAHGIILDRGHNLINMRAGKTVGAGYPQHNILPNTAFRAVDETNNTIPDWTLTGAGVTVETMPAEILEGHNVIKLTVPAGITADLRVTLIPNPMRHTRLTFGAFVKTDTAETVYTTFNTPAGLTSSAWHPGDDEWHFIGMDSIIDPAQTPQPKFWLNNGSGSSNLVIYLTTPTLSYGIKIPTLTATPVTSAGGVMTGTLSTGMTSSTIPGDNKLVLPKDGNVFEITGSGLINRINADLADRFPKGTIITLLFEQAGITVQHNAVGFIRLQSGANYVSTVYSTLTLVSLGSGVWRELWRNV